MDEFFRDNVEIFRRLDLQTEEVDSWPDPEQHHYYKYQLRSSVPLTLQALDRIKDRPDINWIHTKLHLLFEVGIREKLGELLNMNDRSWSVSLEHMDGDPKINKKGESLKRALAVLGNVRLLNFLFDSKHLKKAMLGALPSFNYLQCLHHGWDVLIPPAELIPLSQYPFAPQLDGIKLDLSSISAEEASDISRQLHSNIHAMVIVEQAPEDEDIDLRFLQQCCRH